MQRVHPALRGDDDRTAGGHQRVGARQDPLRPGGHAGRAGLRPPAECAKAAQLHEQAKRLGAEVEAKLATPEAEIQWDRVMKLLELALDILL